jgi:uncharacterized protein YwlG (UPF0340 family)
MRTRALVTLGCSRNEVESEQRGDHEAPEVADLMAVPL